MSGASGAFRLAPRARKGTIMIAKISSIAIAALIVGSASIASAATVKNTVKHPAHHGTVYLLEDRGYAYPVPAGKNFQDKFNIDY
jgi:hypothetical protein